MIQTITFEDYKQTDWWNADHLIYRTLYDPSVGYYPCTLSTTFIDRPTHPEGGFWQVDRHTDGAPMVMHHAGDLLCNQCALDFLINNDTDGAVTAASGMELHGYDDCQTLTCTDCGRIIHRIEYRDLCGETEEPDAPSKDET